MNRKTIAFKLILINLIIMMNIFNAHSQKDFATDKIPAKNGDIEITFIGHGSLMIKYDGKIIQVDPYSKLADYLGFPKADIILLTHHHGDHLDMEAIQKVTGPYTKFFITDNCKKSLSKFDYVTIMENGDSKETLGFAIDAVPAYNIVQMRETGEVFHPKGEGNGYVLIMGGKKIYIAGDTENIPEMKDLKNIDIAFLPMNLPYTMTPEMVADAAKAFKPKILYPYHTGDTDAKNLLDLLRNEKGIDVRIREMK